MAVLYVNELKAEFPGHGRGTMKIFNDVLNLGIG